MTGPSRTLVLAFLICATLRQSLLAQDQKIVLQAKSFIARMVSEGSETSGKPDASTSAAPGSRQQCWNERWRPIPKYMQHGFRAPI